MLRAEMPETLRVSAKSKPNTIAGAVAGVIRERGFVELETVGAAALNQAIKAIAIARGFVISQGLDLFVIPAFKEVRIEGEVRTAIRLLVRSYDANITVA
jgi:stage V sporulation protein S